MSERPAWLADEPELQALLHVVLDRFDQQPGHARQQPVFLPAEKHLPSLARNDATADQRWALVETLARDGVLSIREARRGVYDAPWHGARLAFATACEDTLRRWLDRPPAARAMEAWRRAVAAHAPAFPGGCDLLLQRRIALAGRTPEEIVAALARLGTLPGACTLRQLSAYAFWGDSKVLDERGDLIAALFPRLELVERAIVVAVHLPPMPAGILFIENQDTYTAATRGTPAPARDLALVYASGFRSSAQRIRTANGVLLHFAGSADGRAAFEHWWFDAGAPPGPCHFWGDLDFAGMQILKTLRQRFGAVSAWRPGYAPMLAVLRAAGGYQGGGETRGQIDPVVTGCAFADDELLPAIRASGQLDQEFPTAAGFAATTRPQHTAVGPPHGGEGSPKP